MKQLCCGAGFSPRGPKQSPEASLTSCQHDGASYVQKFSDEELSETIPEGW